MQASDQPCRCARNLSASIRVLLTTVRSSVLAARHVLDDDATAAPYHAAQSASAGDLLICKGEKPALTKRQALDGSPFGRVQTSSRRQNDNHFDPYQIVCTSSMIVFGRS